MKECNEKCMANVNGHCAVKECHGAFTSFSLNLEIAEKAANLYEMCLGCGYEHNCDIHGCALLRQAVETIERQAAAIEDLRDHECSGLIEE